MHKKELIPSMAVLLNDPFESMIIKIKISSELELKY